MISSTVAVVSKLQLYQAVAAISGETSLIVDSSVIEVRVVMQHCMYPVCMRCARGTFMCTYNIHCGFPQAQLYANQLTTRLHCNGCIHTAIN